MLSGRRATSIDQRCGLPQRANPARAGLSREATLYFKAMLPVPGSFLFHDRDVSVGLVGYHFPAAGQAGEDGGLCTALRQQHEAMTFIGLNSASICMVHGYAPSRFN